MATPIVPATTPPATPIAPTSPAKAWWKKPLLWVGVAVVLGVIAVGAWMKMKPSGPGAGFVSGNGRIEATEIDIATKLADCVQEILVNEGDFVKVGHPLSENYQPNGLNHSLQL